MGLLNVAPNGPATPPHASGGGHSILGGIGNLGHDIEQTATGFLPGVVQSVQHPIRAAHAVAHSTWHDWSPLFHGHVHQFLNQTYDHPLAPLLDLATVFTLGDSAAAKLGTAVSKVAPEASAVGKVANTIKGGSRTLEYKPSELSKYHDPGGAPQPMYRTTKATPMKRAMQQALYDHPNWAPRWYGSHDAIYQRLMLKKLVSRAVANQHHVAQAVGAFQSHLAAAHQAGQSLTHAEDHITPVILNHNFDQAVRRPFGVHDPYMRNSSGGILRDANGNIQYRPIPEGFAPIKGDTRVVRDSFKKNDKPFEKRLTDFGNEITHSREAFNSDPQKYLRHASSTAKDAEGNILLLKKDPFGSLMKEGAGSSKFLKAYYRMPTRVWKMAFVGLSPKMVVDNAVGNYTMYGVRQFGHHSVHGLIDAVKQNKSMRGMSDLEKYLNPHWTNQHFADELTHEGMINSLQETVQKKGAAPGVTETKLPLKGGLYPLVHKFADQPVRRATLNSYMRGRPEVRAFQKQGHSFDEAVSKALTNGKTGERLRQDAVDHVRNIAGDYRHLSNTEMTVKDLAPFYLWNRHIARHVRNLAVDHPGRIAAMQGVASRAHAANEARTGPLPSFMDNMIPMGGQHGGHMNMLDGRGLAPYSSVGDLANLGQALTTGTQGGTTGDAVSSIGNPLLTNLIESATGHRMGTDSKVPMHGGVLPTFLLNSLEGTPQYRIADAAVHGGNTPPQHNAKGAVKQSLYAKNLRSILMNLGGFPEKDVNLGVAHGLYQKEHGIKRGRSSGGSSSGGLLHG